ncbi:sulfatase-like hydrolase/transferase [Aidingimonas halophila]|uniref:Phosphoglycerol transferase MdoB n=1 Tax=Aidingimonas halophila TaxID=574349 RepID=A0A1H3EBL2_9GAMM|nr:sulfatase-like hydrolase/transferase [Aidingimonas halophila]GHC33753.1 hypothetical protein GCM10008094_28230 [Aidingimonas halophila]SDX76055.1 Phosphoglycerol transferase MdoB [Aidingimonas halophila]
MSRLLLSLVGLNVLLLLPLWIRYGGVTPWLAADAVLIAAFASVLPATRAGRVGRWGLAALVVLVWLIMLGDTTLQLSLGRPLNLLLDWPLLDALYRLMTGNFGLLVALTVVLLAVVAIVLLVIGIRWLLSTRVPMPFRGWGVVAATAVVTGLGVFGVPLPHIATPLIDTLTAQARSAIATQAARREFQSGLEADAAKTHELVELAGKDVILVFIESYGMALLDDERLAPGVVPGLQDAEARMSSAGLSVVSGRMHSPVQGGQSWLAHASTLGGRWIDNQLEYQLFLDSDQATLVDDFRATGHETVAVMPAITLAWPEGRAYGFDRIYAADDLDYAGPALNWVTMPDQFTLDRFQRDIRDAIDAPIFAKLALISSHAPWTPVLPLIDWDTVGDGKVFDRWTEDGESPETLWQNMDRVREQYAKSVDYAVSATLDWAERHVDDDTLMIVMGDHQASPVVIGEDAGPEVPVHVIAGDESLTRPFREHGFVTGTRPDNDGPAVRMERLRDWLHDAFSRDTTPEETSP